MSNWRFWAMVLGLMLVVAPFTSSVVRASDDEDDDDDDEDVVTLTSSNFDDKIAKAKFALVEFYAPWCGHCKKLKPEYAKAATEIKEFDPEILIGKVDATQHAELGTKFEIQGYPTLKYFVDGKLAGDFSGGRDADGIIKWVKKKAGPFATTVETADEVAEKEKTAEVIVVAYFKEFKGEAYDTFATVGKASEDAVFLQTTSKKAAAAAGLTKAGSIAVITNFPQEERVVASLELGEDSEADDITELIKANKVPTTIEFTTESSSKIFGAGIDKQILLVSKREDITVGSPIFDAYKAAAVANKGKVVFVTVDSAGASKDPVMNFFGIKDEDTPAIVGFEMAKNRKYRLQGEPTADSIASFVASLVDGSAEPEFKSAPIPEDNKDGEVTVVVGKSFEDIVLDPTKDVLLEVYAPWCGHCKQLDPIYKKLAKRFKKVDSIVIAKMDGTENEHADVEVKGFPTIMFFPAGEGKKGVAYDGGRDLKGFTKFLKANAKVPFELPKKGKKDEEEPAAKDEL